MMFARRSVVPLLLLGLSFALLTGCGKKTWYWPFGASEKDKPGAAGGPVVLVDEPLPPAPPIEDKGPTTAPADMPLPPTVRTDASGTMTSAEAIRKPAVEVTDLEMIHFEFDKSEIHPTMQPILDRNAEWILQHPGIQVQIEGHADERGTIEYNLALGQRRAEAVREYLAAKGVDPNSLHTISYGKERPIAFGQTEEDHALNRRAQFLIFTD